MLVLGAADVGAAQLPPPYGFILVFGLGGLTSAKRLHHLMHRASMEKVKLVEDLYRQGHITDKFLEETANMLSNIADHGIFPDKPIVMPGYSTNPQATPQEIASAVVYYLYNIGASPKDSSEKCIRTYSMFDGKAFWNKSKRTDNANSLRINLCVGREKHKDSSFGIDPGYTWQTYMEWCLSIEMYPALRGGDGNVLIRLIEKKIHENAITNNTTPFPLFVTQEQYPLYTNHHPPSDPIRPAM
jgi:hypothetical protein